MKTIITLLLIILASTSRAQNNPATSIAEKIAQKMKDTLSLTGSQKQQIYLINMQLHQSKASVRTEHAGSDSLRIYLQRVENTRDSLYRAVLNEEKYLLYKQKKATLVSSN